MSHQHRINVKEARQSFRALIDRVAEGEEIELLRHGRPVARLLPPHRESKQLPSLAEFRAGLKVMGAPLSQQIGERRGGPHYP
ncbi:MAG: type II toxin-antitoxin system prevent-host-death family antitoxin [Acidobacteriota bacterium]